VKIAIPLSEECFGVLRKMEKNKSVAARNRSDAFVFVQSSSFSLPFDRRGRSKLKLDLLTLARHRLFANTPSKI
jgi:hypothetical protein